MATLLTDLDATCANLGYHEADRYYAEPDALQNLKHLIWILRRDSDTHEYRRHLGRAKVLQTDLLPMLVTYCKDTELSDVLLRLMVNLTNPALLLYRQELPTDGPGQRLYLEIIDHLQGYKAALAQEEAWTVLCVRLQQSLDIDWAERTEDDGLLIERILVFARNILQVPASPDIERRADNDASLHDQVLWALHQSGMLDIVLYITNTQQEHHYHLHAIEIISLMYREQNVSVLANSELQRSATEKEQDEKELVAARRKEQAKAKASKVVGEIRMPPSARHSRFCGTYVLQNVKSISDNDMICHKVVTGPEQLNFNKLKTRIRKPKNKIIIETGTGERRSAFSVRLFLREFCLEFLASSYNTVLRDARRAITHSAGTQDESYLLWMIRFFMEFNRLNGFRLDYISETLSISWFHWVMTCSDKFMEMGVTDKKNVKLWGRRLHLAVQAYREFLLSMQSLVKLQSEEAKALALALQGNVFYVIEYREMVIHLLMHYDEAKNSKSYLRDLIETAHIFSRMLEKYCKSQGLAGAVVVQERQKQHRKKKNKKAPAEKPAEVPAADRWLELAPQVSAVLTSDGGAIPTDVVPFDAASDIDIDQQKEDCMRRVQRLLKQESFEEAIGLLRAAREVWPEHDFFGAANIAPEEELMILNEIFVADIGNKDLPAEEQQNQDEEEEDYEEDEEEEEGPRLIETNFKFADFEMRLCNPKVVRACTMLLSGAVDGSLPGRAVVSACSLLHRVAWSCKCPGMLFQASLFRIFQAALNAPQGTVHEELRRLAVFIVRQFARVAATNNKVFAELLFWKSVRESYALENNYEDDPHAKGKSAAWSEEEELELARLFEENQSNPENDNDVIDWLIENLVTLRTRREVIKKLRDLGLHFSKPTRKSNAEAQNKRIWTHEQDQQLSELYDEHRANEGALATICEAFPAKPEAAIIRRMINLGLIANKKEIAPPKRKSRANLDEDGNPKPRKPRAKKDDTGKKKQKPAAKKKVEPVALNKKSIAAIMQQLEEHDGGIQWLLESFADAIEDLGESENIGDEEGIPLVPMIAAQREALEASTFRDLLRELGVQPPSDEQENYWRIPGKFTVQDIRSRISILEDPNADVGGDEISENNQTQTEEDALVLSDEDEDQMSDATDDSEESVDYLDVLAKKRQEARENVDKNAEETFRESVDAGSSTMKSLTKTIDIGKLLNSEDDEDSTNKTDRLEEKKKADSNKKKTSRIDRKKFLADSDDEETSVTTGGNLNKIEDNSKLMISDDEDTEHAPTNLTVNDTSGKKKMDRMDINKFLMEDSEDDLEEASASRKDADMNRSEVETAMKNGDKSGSFGKLFDTLEDSEDEDGNTTKRQRSESSEDEEAPTAKRNKGKNRRVISDDED